MPKAETLRSRFRSLPRELRQANENAAIRIWRAISWLERMESLKRSDLEGRFVAGWIAFNALYGHLDPDLRSAPDRVAWQEFLVKVDRIDRDAALAKLVANNQATVLPLIDEKYLYVPFWRDGEVAVEKLTRIADRSQRRIERGEALPVLQELFERLYVMRLQIFHGASTKGSRLNRNMLQQSATAMGRILPVLIEVMIENGFEENWGEVCFPPMK